jgi:hypothetical protein
MRWPPVDRLVAIETAGASSMKGRKKPTSGRTFIALLNTVLFFVTGSIAWFIVFLAFRTWFAAPPPFMPVVIVALVGGAMSFVLDVDIVARIFAAIWKVIGKLAYWFSS